MVERRDGRFKIVNKGRIFQFSHFWQYAININTKKKLTYTDFYQLKILK